MIKCWNIRKKYICHADAAGHSGWHMDTLTGLRLAESLFMFKSK